MTMTMAKKMMCRTRRVAMTTSHPSAKKKHLLLHHYTNVLPIFLFLLLLLVVPVGGDDGGPLQNDGIHKFEDSNAAPIPFSQNKKQGVDNNRDGNLIPPFRDTYAPPSFEVTMDTAALFVVADNSDDESTAASKEYEKISHFRHHETSKVPGKGIIPPQEEEQEKDKEALADDSYYRSPSQEGGQQQQQHSNDNVGDGNRFPIMPFLSSQYVGALQIDRILQDDSNVTKSICSNVSDEFRTTIAISYGGNKSALTDEQARIFVSTFIDAYNGLTDASSIGGGGGSSTSNAACDPLFRRITSVVVTTNASFTGSNDGEVLDNPLPLIPVRRLEGTNQEKEGGGGSPLDNLLWKSLLQSNLVDDYDFERQLQQLPSGGTTSGLDRTVGNFTVGLILMDIFGACRGCRGGSLEFSLFDDTSSRRQMRSKQPPPPPSRLRRGLQLGEDEDSECICPEDAAIVDSTTFGTTFNNDIEELRDSGEIDFIEEVEEIIPVVDKVCPTKNKDFSSVYLATKMEFSRTLLVSLGGNGVKRIEKLFRDSYNGIAQQLCDPLYRTVSKVQFVSIVDDSDGVTSTVTLEFVVEATCRGEDCEDIGCIFDDAGSNCERRRKRQLIKNIDIPQEWDPEDEHASSLPLVDENISTSRNSATDGLGPTREKTSRTRLLMDEEDETTERCFCRKGRSVRPATQNEFRLVFQDGLDEITEDSKLDSCLECSLASDCKSGFCLAGRCAESDTELLRNGCGCLESVDCESSFCLEASPQENGVGGVCAYRLENCQDCSNDSDCVSGFCVAGRCGDINGLLEVGCPCLQSDNCDTKRCDALDTGTCQPRLGSCGICTNSTDCISAQCTGGRCAEVLDGKLKTGCDCTSNLQCQSSRCARDLISVGVSGQCEAKITDTCTEPCFISSDCASGQCGSVVCLPNNGTLLPDGCFATSSFECESSRSKNSVCVAQLGLCGVCTAGSDCTAGNCISGRCADSLGKLPNACPCQASLDCASGSCEGSICQAPPDLSTSEPSTVPTSQPTLEPSSKPSGKPSISPTSRPSTQPSISPSTRPSAQPSISPSTRPSFRPTSTPSDQPSSSPTCNDGYEGNGVSCSNIDECALGADDCVSNASCEDTVGSFTCTCNDGFSGDGRVACNVLDCFETTGAINFDQLYTFCNAHSGNDRCCSDGTGGLAGEAYCNNWSGVGFNVCKGSCNGANACTSFIGPGDVTIESGACNGMDSCFNMGTPLLIESNSCVGETACKNVGLAAGSVDILATSCTSTNGNACNGLGGAASSVEVQGGSCNGDRACFELGLVTSSTVKVLAGSCLNDDSCVSLGDGASGSITVGMASCASAVSCAYLGKGATSISIGGVLASDRSCVEYNSCVYLGSTSASSVSVGPKSCDKDSACKSLGIRAPGSVMIGDSSCIGLSSCNDLGNDASSILIQGGSCSAVSSACSNLGKVTTQSISIGPNSCTNGDSACNGLGYAFNDPSSASGPIVIGADNDSACTGTSACAGLGQKANSITVYGCEDNFACTNLGQVTTDSISISTDSCKGGTSVCNQLGLATLGPIVIGGDNTNDDACTGERACFFLGQSATSITISGCEGAQSCENCLQNDIVSILSEEGDNFCPNIDECALGADDCVSNASCEDTVGSFTCTCNDGFSGDGRVACNVVDCYATTGAIDFDQLYAFCNAHSGNDRCCSDGIGGLAGEAYCNNWSGIGFNVCKGSCNGANACTSFIGPGDVTIEKGGCNGVDSCFNMGTPLLIESNSCVGERACQNVGLAAGFIDILANSCRSMDACNGLGGGASSVEVQGESCTGEQSCWLLGEVTESTVKVLAGSCLALDSCRELGDGASGSIKIGVASCAGTLSCAYLGRGATSIIIGGDIATDQSCVEQFSCVNLGSTSASSVSVGPKSCDKDGACKSLGIRATGSVTIGDSSCIGVSSCNDLGNAASSISIQGGSCLESSACSNLGKVTTQSIAIFTDSCKGGDTPCLNLGDASTGQIVIGAINNGACRGKDACNGLGGAASSVDVEGGSCTGEQSCWLLGEVTESTVEVLAGSCLALDSCRELGDGASGSIKIGVASCAGESSCAFLGKLATSIIIGGDIATDKSCVLANSCNRLGSTSPSSLSVGPKSCDQISACQNLGISATGSVMIGASSCIGLSSCNDLGRTSSSISIQGGSCLETSACTTLGGVTPQSISIGPNSCTGGNSACNGLGYASSGPSASGPIVINAENDSACTGTSACAGLGQKANSITVDGCRGNFACTNLGQVTTDSISIGADACDGDNDGGTSVCNQLGLASTGQIVIGAGNTDDACTGERACFSLGQSATSITISGCEGAQSCENCLQNDIVAISIEDDVDSCPTLK